MTLYDLKPRFQALLRPVLRGLAHAGLTANQVTLLALLLSLALGLALVLHPSPLLFLLLPPFLFIRMALNAIDGLLAREFNQQSRLGAVLNEVGDVVSDAALYLPFALLPGADPMAVVVMVLLANLTEFVGVTTQAIGAGRRYDGPLGKSDRAFVLGAYALAVGLYAPALAWSAWLFWVLAALSALTCLNRVRRALKESR
ncbi:CDP-alcohol phosphatidyltransferase family protein [Chitiniphilus eburneus]|uniref:CDP-alcohol phosphatidyltransferase family protein n=1 Tax=Chitiniphilus eburneus TaxID=2571148 RepID=A0A4U0PZ82_9NEIS|nr:CDP-alcohol phosphatidyltransferase family protein [Chitiniphilus eburneus]TJZ73983.1 CDP-alcohol phosphatidyltransferase family protein [Chitiniphilus eburneus]